MEKMYVWPLLLAASTILNICLLVFVFQANKETSKAHRLIRGMMDELVEQEKRLNNGKKG